MSNTIIIRKANKDYVCDVCGHIIKAGSEYLDRAIINNGKCVQHERYHDECPKMSSVMMLFSKLEKNDCYLIAAHKTTGEKIHIIGIRYACKNTEVYYCKWSDNLTNVKKMSISEITNYHDCNGNNLI